MQQRIDSTTNSLRTELTVWRDVVTDLKTGLVTQASGSAYIETGKTKLICAVSVYSLFSSFPLSSTADN